MNKKLKFIDLFAGIGGFHLALNSLGMTCVFTSEIDEFARKTYAANFKETYLNDPNLFAGDIWKVDFMHLIYPIQHFTRIWKMQCLILLENFCV